MRLNSIYVLELDVDAAVWRIYPEAGRQFNTRKCYTPGVIWGVVCFHLLEAPASTFSVSPYRGAGSRLWLGETIGIPAQWVGRVGMPWNRRPARKLPVNFASVVLLAFAMSTDAFAAAVGKGAALNKPRFTEALKTGAIFGAIEATTPIIGWGLGQAAAPYVSAWDHWIAFVLLFGLGLLMIRNACTANDDMPESRPEKHSFWLLAVTGFATSIDAMAVGVGLAFLDVDIIPIALAVGFTTLVLVTCGVMLGRALGALVGRRAEIAGGLILIGIGIVILIEHLSA